VQGGLGEASCLAMCAFYQPQRALTLWSSGTGFAGVAGYTWVAGLHTLGAKSARPDEQMGDTPADKPTTSLLMDKRGVRASIRRHRIGRVHCRQLTLPKSAAAALYQARKVPGSSICLLIDTQPTKSISC
jgi:CLN3 protein